MKCKSDKIKKKENFNMSLNIKEPKFKVLNNCTPNNTCFITYKQSVL